MPGAHHLQGREYSVAQRKKKTKKSKPRYSAKTADKHELYQLSVQDPESEIQFVTRVFQKLNGKKPMSIREDFCGTAFLCGEWIKSHKDRTASGIDFDQATLDWGTEHNLKAIDEPGSRIKLYSQDVRKKVPGKFDVGVGMNFSYWTFRNRPAMLAYFKCSRSTIKPGGIFVLDAYGGYESIQPMEEPRRITGGATYVWDQDSFNPIDNSGVNHIHFEFRDGTKMRKAFTYEWRFWSLLEIQELLAEAGFKKSTVYWEDADDDGEGTGVFRPRKKVENEAAWVAYIVAEN